MVNSTRIVRFHETGDSGVLRLEKCEAKKLGAGEISIRVQAIGLNRAEVLFRQGKYLESPKLPARIGYEASGIVQAIADDVTDFKPGDYVSTIPSFSQSIYGVYGEEAIVPARACVVMPKSMPPAEAASVWMAYLTAYGALVEIASIDESSTVVVTAASSSVGLAALQLINDIGAKPIATTRSSAKKELLLKAGAAHVIVTEEEPLSESILSLSSNRGADIIFDAVAGPSIAELAKATALEGRIIIYGALSLASTPFPLRAALRQGITIAGYTMFQITNDDARLAKGRDYVLERLRSGAFQPLIDKRFKLDDIAEAHRYMESNQQLGKIVVHVD